MKNSLAHAIIIVAGTLKVMAILSVALLVFYLIPVIENINANAQPTDVKGYRARAEKRFGLPLKEIGEVVDFADTHGGFLGDGEGYLECSDMEYKKIEDSVSGREVWNSLDEKANREHLWDYLGQSFAIVKEIPIPKRGYYLFYDEQTELDSPFSNGEEIFESGRFGYNFDVLILDSDKNRIVLYSLDT